MVLKTKGKPHKIDTPIVGRVTKLNRPVQEHEILISENEIPDYDISFFKAVLTNIDISNIFDKPSVYSIPTFEHLNEGDIVVINSDGVVNTLYRVNSHHNSLLVTERCNSNCLMCSQPPKDKNDIDYLFSIHQELIPLIPKNCIELGITGGEPTLLGDHFFSLLKTLQIELPDTEIHCLTNGRTFAWKQFAKLLSNLNYSKLMLGIPLYSDYYHLHDYIVQSNHAFNQTIHGLYNLAEYNQRIELRIVLHKQTIPRLVKLAKYIYKNLPFVEHVAFMGLEYIGYTPHNIETLWIDPFSYQNELNEAVCYLADCGINVSIYNSQLCLLPEHLWQYCRKSISDWKNSYLPECQECAMLNECGGLFTWNISKHSDYIKPFYQDIIS